MKNKFIKIFIKKIGLDDPKKAQELITRFYIKKYGSFNKANSVFIELQESCVDDDEFQKVLKEKLEKDFHVNYIQLLLKPFTKAKNITSLVEEISIVEGSILTKFSQEEAEIVLSDFENLMKPAFEETFNFSQNKKEDIIQIINTNLKLSLSSTRKELGYPDQRTFDKWLVCFFKVDNPHSDKLKHKFSYLGKKNGYLSLDQYIEIVSAFMLSYDEKSLDLYNAEELHTRFEKDRFTQKKFLKKFTKNSYALLRERIEDIAEIKGLELPENYRNIPYSIVSIIKKELNEYVD